MESTNRIQYEDRQGHFLSSETRDFLIELSATALAGIVVILVFIGVTVQLRLL